MKTNKATPPSEETNHAERNAQAWMDSIKGMIAAMEKAEDERDEATFDGETFDADGWRERIQECPLEVSVRAGWHNPGNKAEDEEFLILLSTGGPALRIVGDLGKYNNPKNPRLQYQDWGTPWTEYATDADQDEALEKFCAQFYFGDQCGDEHKQENARLIASAPDLLAALKSAVSYLEANRPKGKIRGIFTQLNEYENGVLKPARAAIAQAEGGAQ